MASISPTAMSLTAMTHTRTSWTTFALSRKPRRCGPGLSPAMRCLPRKRLREIAGRLTAAGEWDTESIYESLTEAFGNNLSLDKQSKDDTKEEERNINIKQDQLDLLWQLEEFRKKHEHQAEPSDWAIRMCEAFVARSMGFTDGTVDGTAPAEG